MSRFPVIGSIRTFATSFLVAEEELFNVEKQKMKVMLKYGIKKRRVPNRHSRINYGPDYKSGITVKIIVRLISAMQENFKILF